MKILVVCQYYYPENFQITPICEALVDDGYDVTVLTGLPNYPTGIVPEEYKTGHRKEVVNGVKVIRCYECGRRKNAVGLAFNYGSFLVSAMQMIKHFHIDYDLVFCYQLSPITMAFPAMKFAMKNSIPFLLYCCDIWPESLKMYVKNEHNPVYVGIKRMSKKIYCSADRIVVQSKSFIDYLSLTHGIDKEKFAYIPAFAEETYLTSDFTPEDDTVDFVFLGNLGLAQDLFSVLAAIEQIKEVSGFKVHFVGDGVCLEEMRAYVSEKNLESIVRFYGRRPVEEMVKYYKLADACLVSLRADNATGYTLPTKIQGYMAAGKPIIAMLDGSAKDVIEESGCGICVEAGDRKGLSNAMKSFITNREEYLECGERGRDFFRKNFRQKVVMERLKKEIQNTTELQNDKIWGKQE